MPEVSLFRLTLLRAMYLLLVVGLGLTVWPPVLRHSLEWPLMSSVVCSLLAAVALLALLGLRHPLAMLPLLVFELAWKTIWLLAVGLPLWSAGRLAGDAAETARDCLIGVVLVLAVVPWRYAAARYLLAPGDRWRSPPMAPHR